MNGEYISVMNGELRVVTCDEDGKVRWVDDCCPPLSRKRGDIKSHSSVPLSVCLSVCHKNFNLGHNFCTITDRALILGTCVPCDKTFPVVPCRDLDGDL